MGNSYMQDFSKKMTIVLRDDVASWQLTNTIGHIAAYLGNKMTEPFDTGKYFVSKDKVKFPRNSQFPIVALRANESDLKSLEDKLRGSNLLWMVYVQEMIDMADDRELAEALSVLSSAELNILGIGIFGSSDELKKLTGELRLWR
jgi:hypothetical protein